MTNQLEALIADMKAAAKKATPGEWWSDVVETGGTHGNGEDCMEGFHSYAVYDQKNHSLLDMTNSTAAVITVEDDGDYVTAWDEVARRNAEFIALVNPANTLTLIAALEQSEKSEEVAELLRDKVKRLESELWDKEQLRKVYSEKSWGLEQAISSMKYEHAKNQSWLAGQVREMEDALCKLLPGSQYMDEPDGGDVSPLEQVTRMVADYRQYIAELEASQLSVKLPPHKYSECVSGLLEEAIAYSGTQQLRARLASRLSNFVMPGHEAGITVQGDE